MQERRAREIMEEILSRDAPLRGNERSPWQMFFKSAVANQAESSLFAEICLQDVLSRDECFIREINFSHVNDAELD